MNSEFLVRLGLTRSGRVKNHFGSGRVGLKFFRVSSGHGSIRVNPKSFGSGRVRKTSGQFGLRVKRVEKYSGRVGSGQNRFGSGRIKTRPVLSLNYKSHPVTSYSNYSKVTTCIQSL